MSYLVYIATKELCRALWLAIIIAFFCLFCQFKIAFFSMFPFDASRLYSSFFWYFLWVIRGTPWESWVLFYIAKKDIRFGLCGYPFLLWMWFDFERNTWCLPSLMIHLLAKNASMEKHRNGWFRCLFIGSLCFLIDIKKVSNEHFAYFPRFLLSLFCLSLSRYFSLYRESNML